MKRWHQLLAVFAFGVPIFAYIRTLTPTVPFWDSGEYIATSYILGLPHPPGNPVYTMIGRFLSMIPFESVAWRVNFMSALSSALTALFTFFIVSRLLRRTYGGRTESMAQWIGCELGGLVAAFFVAFSTSFWDSAIEAEVYALSSFIISFTIWLALNWWDRLGTPGNDKILVLITYILSVSTGIHLGTVLVTPGLLVLLWMVRPQTTWSTSFWSAALPIGLLLGLMVLNETHGLGISPGLFLLGFAGLLIYFGLNRDRLVKNNLGTWWLVFILVGFTVQLFLLIRSQQMPAINEGMPTTIDTWTDYLARKQYGPSSPFLRRADLWYQIDHMYFRFVWQQFQIVSRIGPFDASSFWVRLVNLVPFALFFAGAWWNFKRDRKSFWFLLTQQVVMGPFLIFYLNFTDHEVRERDYFFTNSYYFIAIWMGMGATAVLHWLSSALRPEARAVLTPVPSAAGLSEGSEPALLPLPHAGSARAGFWISVAALIGISLLPMKVGWYKHDRSNFYLAHDYAYNMLTPLERNAIVFTNGDNDTFPLWYIQEVEGLRKDVRVVNLSLLNTPWYIQQLRDQEPKVPLSYTNAQLATLQPYMDEKTNQVFWVKDQAVADIVKTNNWLKPLYLAVTVPEQMGMEPRLSLEGLVFRVNQEPPPSGIDVEKTVHNIYSVFKYGGLLDKNRAFDNSVYKDENAYRLAQNYTAAHVQVAYQMQMAGRTEDAIRFIQDALKMSPDFPGLLEYLGRLYEDAGRPEEAYQIYQDGVRRYPNSAEFYYHLGVMKFSQGHIEEGIASLRKACELNQQYFDWFNALFTALWQSGQKPEALEVLRGWVRAHPEDREGAANLARFEDSLGTTGGPARGATGR